MSLHVRHELTSTHIYDIMMQDWFEEAVNHVNSTNFTVSQTSDTVRLLQAHSWFQVVAD
jgi:hypothetical protein